MIMTTVSGAEVEANLYDAMVNAKVIGKVIDFLLTRGLGYRKILGAAQTEAERSEKTKEEVGLAGFDVGTFD
jgi:hypothetical protein